MKIPVDANGNLRIPASARKSVESLVAWGIDALLNKHSQEAILENIGDRVATYQVQRNTKMSGEGYEVHIMRLAVKIDPERTFNGKPNWENIEEIAPGQTVYVHNSMLAPLT
ncbi:hypothetical protein V0288_04590 [Pannus brasiliensis CCIBt3594]|uniref:SpoVT-AbrB domain-containing protein n=1 Tax=Pannus brasiliensis CCIBt3594 TaxID=1427578 RepID=A0AAW9QU14_9CHRO